MEFKHIYFFIKKIYNTFELWSTNLGSLKFKFELWRTNDIFNKN